MITAQLGDSKDIWTDCKAVFFMGTPHRGSKHASYGKTLGDIVNFTLRTTFIHRSTGGVPTRLIKALDPENEELQRLSEDFDKILEGSTIQIISLYETELNPFTDKIVCTVNLSR